MRYLARISYDGSKFLGFQRLKNDKGVQNELERVLKILAKKEILIHGAGRTDAGVHALDQCIHFDLDISISVDKLKYVMNRLLKDSVVVNSIQVVSNDFHARYDVKEKTYEYFLLLKEKNAFLSNYAYIFYQDLDIEKMKEASHVFLGTHDFSNFVSGERENSVSTINDIQFSLEKNRLKIIVQGHSFYRYMVRNIVGALIDVGLSKITKEDLRESLEHPDIVFKTRIAPPNGLYLKKIVY